MATGRNYSMADLQATYGLSKSDPGFNPDYDVDHDGIVTIKDFSALRQDISMGGEIAESAETAAAPTAAPAFPATPGTGETAGAPLPAAGFPQIGSVAGPANAQPSQSAPGAGEVPVRQMAQDVQAPASDTPSGFGGA